MAWFKFIMFFVWVAAMALACWAWEVARVFARRMKREALRRQAESTSSLETNRAEPGWPPVAVILPIKGVDEDTQGNIQALLSQDYPRYRLLFTMESEGDPVVPLLRRLQQQSAHSSPPMDIVIAGLASSRGQKIHNQLAAIDQTGPADQILVFMDADAHPASGWLKALVQPLLEPRMGARTDILATTGFRFYVPRHPRRHLADAMVSIINAAVAALLGPGWRNIAWGGSMAIRRDDFFSREAGNIHAAWQNALSDDYVLSWCIRHRARKSIRFVQACLVASTCDFSWPEFFEFAARQYRITKICAPFVWLTAIAAALFYLVGLAYTLVFFLLSATGLVPADSLTGSVDYFLLLMFLALYIANAMRGWFLVQGGLAALPAYAGNLRPLTPWYTLGYPVSLAVNLLALLRSAAGRTITWRGVRYTMHSRLHTTVHRPRPHPASPAPLPAALPRKQSA